MMLMATFGCGKFNQASGLNYLRAKKQLHGLMYSCCNIEKKRRNIGSSLKIKYPLSLRRNQEDHKVTKRCYGIHHR